jgi:hypothetical protein
LCEHIKNGEEAEKSGTYGGEERCVHSNFIANRGKETTGKNVGVEGRIILKWI